VAACGDRQRGAVPALAARTHKSRLNGAGLTSVRYAPPSLHRKPQLCGPFLAILFSELILAPLEFRKFLPSRFEEAVTPV
jgi:hypothetical protein